MEIIKIKDLIKNKYTYPSWSTDSVYPLEFEENSKNIIVYYDLKNRRVKREFSKGLILTKDFIYVLGLLKGEGSNSLGKSNYRRFTITNSDYKIILKSLKELDKQNLLKKEQIKDKSIHLLHFKKNSADVIDYWSKKLNLPKNKFKCFNDNRKTSNFGVCHVYISDVLLRRIVDLLHEKFI